MSQGQPPPERPSLGERAVLAVALVGAAVSAFVGYLVLLFVQAFLGYLLNLFVLAVVLASLAGFVLALLVLILRRKPPAAAGAGATIESLQTRQL